MNEQVEKKFIQFRNRGESPFDYERQVFDSHFERILRIFNGQPSPPYEIEIQPSSMCNIECGWCVGEGYSKLSNTLPSSSLLKIAKDIVEFTEDGLRVETIKFSGFVGEPLVNPATVDGIDYFVSEKKRVGLFTNGMLINKVCSSGRRYLDSIVDINYIHISIDSGSIESTHALKGKNADFDKIVQNIQLLRDEKEKRKKNITIGIGYIIAPENIHEISTSTRIMKDSGANFIRFKYDLSKRFSVDDQGEKVKEEIGKAKQLADPNFSVIEIPSADQMNISPPTPETVKCYTTKLWGTIGSNGSLYACDHRTHGGCSPIADLKVQSFREVWNARKEILPDSQCTVCSPFASRMNEFLTYLSTLPNDDLIKLHKKYARGVKNE